MKTEEKLCAINVSVTGVKDMKELTGVETAS